MILGSDRAKLSKRHGAVSIIEYREQGYLPETMVNFLALLGWSLDDKTELLSREELVCNFSLERVSRTAAVFNPDKLNWMNGIYIRRLSVEDFAQQAIPFLERDLPLEVKRPLSTEYIRQIAPLIQERAKTLAEAAELAQFFFVDQLDYDSSLLIGKGMSEESAKQALETAKRKLESEETFDTDSLEAVLRPLAEELGLKAGQLFGVLRIAVTGRTAAPPLFQTMSVLGKVRCLERIETALNRLLRLC